MDLISQFWVVAGILVLVILPVKILIKIWWIPRALKAYFESQGVYGPPYKPPYGNIYQIMDMMKMANSSSIGMSHDILARVLPEIHSWIKLYGKNFVYWVGPTPRVVIPQPDLIKEILFDTSGAYGKPEPPIQLRQLSGDGLANTVGEKWVRQKRILNPAFRMESLKRVVPVVVESTTNMFKKWDRVASSEGQEIEVLNEFRSLTADVFARAAFGSSYEDGKVIFELQVEQAMLVVESFKKFNIPGYRFLPTKENLRASKLDREIQRALHQIITNREKIVEEMNGYGSDLLGLMMAATKKEHKNFSMSYQDMIDECKTFFAAGHETTAILLAWIMVLLAMHTDWQEKARKEVLQACKNEPPSAEIINRLKIVNMILHEVLRLYPPFPTIARKVYKDVKLGNFNLPKGTEITIPVGLVHHEKELWGNDSHEFNPQRFEDGVSNASKHPSAYMPFGLGPRICIGLNFSMLEAKVVLAMILQRFSFKLSPGYVHAPSQNFTISPQYGAQIMFKKI